MPKSLTISHLPGKPGQVYYPLSLTTTPIPTPTSPSHLVLKILSCSLNHRDLFIRQSLYPSPPSFTGVPLFSDTCALVLSTGSSPLAQRWQGKRVVLNPGTGWKDHPAGPEDDDDDDHEAGGGYRILGGTEANANGTGQEYMVVEAGEVEEAPAHLSHVQAAALPLAGLTAWRALMVKSGVGREEGGGGRRRRRVLITGIGGGVALMVLLFAVGTGAEVWVTSGSEEKIERARELGARGGVSYREEGWERSLLGLVREGEGVGGGLGLFDAIVDGAGGDVVEKGVRILKAGGVIVSYGMTLGPRMPFTMQAVLKNIEIKGSTMGSRKEFKDMIDFVKRKELRPVISRTVRGIDNIEGIDSLFSDMKRGSQFGKLVIEIAGEGGNAGKL